jgi:16S rRNA U516 pseudouridylate synthase RsuA-like enzyme
MSSIASTDTSASCDELSTESFLLHKPIKVLCSTVDSRLYDRFHNYTHKLLLPESKAQRKKDKQRPERVGLKDERDKEELRIREKWEAKQAKKIKRKQLHYQFLHEGQPENHNDADDMDGILIARDTVYDMAALAGFPTQFPLVGRLDYDTSGIMLFTKNHKLFLEINTPIECDHEFSSGTVIEENLVESNVLDLFSYKKKVYEVKLLAGREVLRKMRDEGYALQNEALEKQFSAPFTFCRQNVTYFVKEFHQVKVLRIYQDVELMKGRSDLGWCVDVEVTLLEGKNQQIRRMARRNFFSVISLKRVKIAGILSLDSGIEEPGSCRWLTKSEESRIFEGIRRSREQLHSKPVSSPHRFLNGHEGEISSDTIDNDNELEQASFSSCSNSELDHEEEEEVVDLEGTEADDEDLVATMHHSTLLADVEESEDV